MVINPLHQVVWLLVGGCLLASSGCARAGFNVRSEGDGSGPARDLEGRRDGPTDLEGLRDGPTDLEGLRDGSTGATVTVAGSGVAGFVDGPVATAQFKFPHGVLLDGQGGLLVADSLNCAVRRIAGGQVSRVAGTVGACGYVDGPALDATLEYPEALALDPGGSVLIGDKFRIRQLAGGVLSTVAGSTGGFLDGPAKAAKFNRISGVLVSPTGIVVADWGNLCLRMVQSGQVTTLAGKCGSSGIADGPAMDARFANPHGLVSVTEAVGDVLYVTDSNNHTIRRVDKDGVTTFAGSPAQDGCKDGPVSAATFSEPKALAANNGRLFIGDAGCHSIRLIKAGQVTTISGTGAIGCTDGPNSSATWTSPESIAFDSATSTLIVSDTVCRVVRRVTY